MKRAEEVRRSGTAGGPSLSAPSAGRSGASSRGRGHAARPMLRAPRHHGLCNRRPRAPRAGDARPVSRPSRWPPRSAETAVAEDEHASCCWTQPSSVAPRGSSSTPSTPSGWVAPGPVGCVTASPAPNRWRQGMTAKAGEARSGRAQDTVLGVGTDKRVTSSGNGRGRPRARLHAGPPVGRLLRRAASRRQGASAGKASTRAKSSPRKKAPARPRLAIASKPPEVALPPQARRSVLRVHPGFRRDDGAPVRAADRASSSYQQIAEQQRERDIEFPPVAGPSSIAAESLSRSRWS